MIDQNNDQTSTITIGNTVINTNLNHNLNSLNGNLNKNDKDDIGFGLIERNFKYILQQLNYIIKTRFQSSSSIFAPAICFIITFVYFINLLSSPRASNGLDKEEFHKTESIVSSMLTLVPGNILSPTYWLWSCISFFTYPFVEYHWYSVINDIIVVTLCTNLIEPLLGRKELVTFFFVVNIFVAFFTIMHYILLYSFYGDAKYLYNVRLYGLSGYCAAVCVTIKQILPESVLVNTSFGKIKNNHLPLCALCFTYLFFLVGWLDGILTLMFFYGLLISWFYLRFVQYHPSNNLRGDLSPAFEFSTLFPKVLKPFVSAISSFVYSIFVKFHLLSPNSYRQYQNLLKLSDQFSKEQSEIIISRHFNKQPNDDYPVVNESLAQSSKVEDY